MERSPGLSRSLGERRRGDGRTSCKVRRQLLLFERALRLAEASSGETSFVALASPKGAERGSGAPCSACVSRFGLAEREGESGDSRQVVVRTAAALGAD